VFSCKHAFLFLAFVPCAGAEVHNFTLPQALEMAARQNPDVVLARLDRQHAEYGIQVAQDPFRPKVYVGSGLAYTYGYPNSIEGNAPSLFQVRTDMALFNRPKSYNIASAREIARGAELGTQAKAEEVAYQAADLFLRASQLQHESQTINNQLPSLQKVVGTMAASVSEGTELPLELKRARVNLAVSEQRLDSNKLDTDYYEMMLAVALGYSANDRVKPVDSDLSSIAAPPSETEAADTAMRNNKELRQMQSNILAKAMDVRSFKAARLPQVDLVAQYALFAKYNYENYFQKFQRNNLQLGVSVAIPLLIGSASNGMAQEAYSDMQKLRVQMDQTRNRILTDTRRSYQVWQNARSMRDLARMQLDLAREELTVLLAQNGEGRVPLSKVEQARLEESNKWMVFYEADVQEVRAKLAILRQTGNLLAAVHANGQGTAQP
jgi:outer membrane protein TolC